VGTSAGSLIGSLLRLGVPATDMAALEVGGSTLETHADLVRWHQDRRTFPPFDLVRLLGRPSIPRPSALLGLGHAIARRGIPGLGALTVLLPDGRETLVDDLEVLESTLGRSWPDDPLLVCGTRRRDCRRAVFGQGARPARLAHAVAASCAVPGYFRGVEIDGEVYVDGGVLSATNADVLRRHELDLVVVVSPMTAAASFPSVSHLIRAVCRATLDREVRALQRRGIPSVIIEPSAETAAHMPGDFMSEESTLQLIRQAFLDTGRQIAQDRRLHDLRRTTARRDPA